MSWPMLFSLGILLFSNASVRVQGRHGEDNLPYADAEEEELMDKLASWAAGAARDVGQGARYPSYPTAYDFDLPLPDYSSLGRDATPPGYGNKEAGLEILPRKFAYTPKDPRFFLPSRIDGNELGKADLETLLQLKKELENDIPYQPLGYPPEVADQLNAESDSNRRFREEQPSRQDPNSFMKKSPGLPAVYEQKKNFISKAAQVGGETTGEENFLPQQQDYNPSHVLQDSQHAEASGAITSIINPGDNSPASSILYIALIAGCSATVVIAVVAAGICWYRIHERVKAAAEVDYPAYGVTGPSKDVSPSGGDRKLAQSAHMYHYQHQKQQMTAMQKNNMQGDRQGSAGSDIESEDENEDGDYTVYECPGLAGLCNTGEMEVKNPLYEDEPTPATPNTVAAASTENAETNQK